MQLPAWAAAIAIGLALERWTSLSGLWLGLAVAVYIGKDFALYPFVRRAYEPTTHEPGAELVGARARVVVALDPEGWVEVRHERWRARVLGGDRAMEVGAEVRIRSLEGQTVWVEPASPAP